MKKNILLLLFVLSNSFIYTQIEFVRNDYVQVTHENSILQNAWAGGINSAQVSRIDLNGDNILDLFIFDKVGNRIMPFINTNNTPGAVSYKHDFEYVDLFPDMRAWVLLRDFNCDGLVDIFTNNFNSIMVYENTSVDGVLSFELRTEAIYSSYNYSGTPFNAPMYCLSVDIPSIVDLDEDGDLDIITWSDNNVTIFYYENLGADMGNCDTLAFQLGNRCYGMINEATESADVFISEEHNCDFNVINPTKQFEKTNKHVHAGGIILNIDLDQNGLKDLIISDVTDLTMTSILMLPSVDDLDSAFSVTTDFPMQYQSTTPVNFSLFPAGYYEDINNDGISDLFSSPNLTSGTRDYNSLWYYKNNGENDLPNFEFIEENFMQKTMIDVGRGALPVLVDYNNDGLMDLIVANQKAFTNANNQPTRLALYKNIGDPNFPAFELIDSDFLEISSLGLNRVYPAFGDLDGDSDSDLVIGDKEGKLYHFENTAAIGEEANWVVDPNPILDAENNILDIGKDATPQLFDVDNDGILDLLIGEENGNINYFHNDGTATNYSFAFIEDTIGDVVASNFLGIKGSSIPMMWRDNDNQLQLLVGTETGILSHYNNIENNISGTFSLITESVEDINEGPNSAPALYDFTGDGKLDMITGNIGGGLAFYEGGTSVTINIEENDQGNNSLQVFPNPTKDHLQINFDSSLNKDNILTVFDVTGKLIRQERNILTGHTLNMANYESGIYFIVIQKDSNTYTTTFVLE